MASGGTVLIDYGSGNIRSVAKALERTAADAGLAAPTVTNDAELVRKADRILLPGQGAYGDCLAGLKAVDGMVEALTEAVIERAVPFLGICVGMQLLADEGHEYGVYQGLGWIPGRVKRFADDLPKDIKIPHMGWTPVEVQNAHEVTHALDGQSVYFAHSYHFHADNPDQVLLTASHGEPLVAAVGRDNILGLQFHPEKSQSVGLGLIGAFQRWRP